MNEPNESLIETRARTTPIPGTDRTRLRLVPIIDRSITRWAPIPSRIIRTTELVSDLSSTIDEATEAWDGDHPTLRAPKDRLNEFEITFGQLYSRDFQDKFLKLLTLKSSEALHHLRSALDYLVFQLVLIGNAKPNRNTQFFVRDSRKSFKKERNHYMPGIRSKHSEIIEMAQPFKGAEWANHLIKLNNIDKHRHTVDVVPVYEFDYDPKKLWADPKGSPDYIGYQVENSTLKYCFSELKDSNNDVLEITSTLHRMAIGAINIVNEVFALEGVPLISVISEKEQGSRSSS